jgi:hypothetical protein
LWRSASVWMVAWIGRGMVGFGAVRHWDFGITQRDITLCRLETDLKFCVDQPA